MIKQSIRLCFICILLLCINLVTAKTIYKSKDANGNTILSDMPTEPEAKSFSIDSEPSLDSAAPPVTPQKTKPSSETTSENDTNTDETTREQKSPITLAEQIQKTCDTYRKNLVTLQKQQPVFTVDTGGNRVFLSDEERATEIESLEKNINTFCR